MILDSISRAFVIFGCLYEMLPYFKSIHCEAFNLLAELLQLYDFITKLIKSSPDEISKNSLK
jgi:hypothetical protein